MTTGEKEPRPGAWTRSLHPNAKFQLRKPPVWPRFSNSNHHIYTVMGIQAPGCGSFSPVATSKLCSYKSLLQLYITFWGPWMPWGHTALGWGRPWEASFAIKISQFVFYFFRWSSPHKYKNGALFIMYFTYIVQWRHLSVGCEHGITHNYIQRLSQTNLICTRLLPNTRTTT